MDYIDKNNIFKEKQYGLRSNYSTYVAIIELVNKVTNSVEKKKKRKESTLCIFLDLTLLITIYYCRN